MTIYVKQSGSWERVQEVHTNNSGTWEHIDQSISINDSGTWRQVHATGTQEYDTAGSYNFTVPDGVHYMTLSIAGAGGGAGGAYYSDPGWGGGGAGFADSVEVEVTPGSTLNIVIGIGGAGKKWNEDSWCAGGTCRGDDGTASTITGLNVTGNVTSATVTCNGGGGGDKAGNTNGGVGGTTSGIIGGTTGTDGTRDADWGYGGASLGGTVASGYGTGPYTQENLNCNAVDGDDPRGAPYAAGKGTGGGGQDDGSGTGCGGDSYGWGGDGSDGYLLLEWGNYE